MAFAEGTTVPVSKTRGEIEGLVTKYGATRFASGWDESGAAAINFVAHGRLVRFVLRLPTVEEGKKKAPRRYSWATPTDAQVQKWIDGESRRRWRCLLLAIKAKLEVVETGIETFEQAFLANIVTTGNMTIYERLRFAEGDGQKLLPAVDP
jgi:hypothetical protein